MSTEPSERTAHPMRLTGFAQFIDTLANLGLIRFGLSDRERLGTFAADDGQPVPLQVSGRGPPVVLVHGLGCSHRHWARVARRLAPRYCVFAPDARGHGRCTHVESNRITLARLARDLANLIDTFHLERVVLVGHSMGALTVMQYLQDFGSARVAAAAVVDQSPRVVTDGEWRLGLFGGCSAQMLSALIEGARANLADTVLQEIGSAAAWLKHWLAPEATVGRWMRAWLGRVDVGPLLDLAETLAAADFRGLLSGLEVPLLVVLGGRSPHYGGLPLDAYYRAAVRRVQVEIYPRSGHSPHYAEPARFARDLERFIASKI